MEERLSNAEDIQTLMEPFKSIAEFFIQKKEISYKIIIQQLNIDITLSKQWSKHIESYLTQHYLPQAHAENSYLKAFFIFKTMSKLENISTFNQCALEKYLNCILRTTSIHFASKIYLEMLKFCGQLLKNYLFVVFKEYLRKNARK